MTASTGSAQASSCVCQYLGTIGKSAAKVTMAESTTFAGLAVQARAGALYHADLRESGENED